MMRTCLSLLIWFFVSGSANADDPKVPAGIDPGLQPVAIVTTGIDYTDPTIAARLARDGEGELIGWDFTDNDRRPFAASPNTTPPNWGGDGTVLVRRWLLASDSAPFSVIPVRIDPKDPVSLGKALAFVAQTQAKAVVVPMWTDRLTDWDPFSVAARQFGDLVVTLPECAPDKPEQRRYPADLDLPNLKRVPVVPATASEMDAAVAGVCASNGVAAEAVKAP